MLVTTAQPAVLKVYTPHVSTEVVPLDGHVQIPFHCFAILIVAANAELSISVAGCGSAVGTARRP